MGREIELTFVIYPKLEPPLYATNPFLISFIDESSMTNKSQKAECSNAVPSVPTGSRSCKGTDCTCVHASWGVGWSGGREDIISGRGGRGGPWAEGNLRKPKNATKKHEKSTKEEETEHTRLLCAFPLLQKKKDAEHDANKRIRLQLNNWQRTWVERGGA